jgi:gliding motility-associated-like protein
LVPVVTESLDPVCEGTKTYTFTYTDCAGNVAVTTYTYTIEVSSVPVVPADASSTVECLADATQPTAPTVTDACGNELLPVVTESADPNGEGTKTYTFTYTDCAGNVAVYTYTYTIDDTTPPVAPTLENLIGECSVTATAPTTTDNCAGIITATTTNPLTYTTQGTYTINWTFDDGNGNSITVKQSVTIEDITKPTFIENLPTNLSIECDAVPIAPILNATDNCGIATVIFNEVRIDGDCVSNYILERTWTATDVSGLKTIHTQTITVKDTTAPVLQLPANVTAECSADFSPIALGTAIATDNCDADPVITFTDVVTPGSCPGNYTITRTWTATDVCGNSVSEDQIITVQDTTAPTFVEALPGDITVECDAIPAAQTLTATDNCGTATVTVNDVITAGSCDNNYTIARTWTATDECGLTSIHTQTITVRDTTAPMFVEALPGDITVECDAIPATQTLTATDNCGTATVTVNDVITNGSCPNSYTIARTWTATDECGLRTSHTQTITVQDTKAPTFVEALPGDITVECDAIPAAQALTATDNCGSATVTVNDVITNGSCPNSYTIARTWTATDECGLRTSHTQTITVEDKKAPTLTTPFDTVINVSCTNIPDIPSLRFTDTCSSNVTVAFEETSTFDESRFADYQIVRTWIATDECGNSITFTQTINVTLDEVINRITTEDRCYDDGAVDLNDYLMGTNSNGFWELIEGNPVATLSADGIFNPTTLALNSNFVPQDGGINYVFRYTTIENGCINIIELNMNINADCVVLPCGENDVEISKAVTPNGDGINDTFDIMGIELCGFEANVKIFNRWGALIFESDNYQPGKGQGAWSGRSKSSIGSADTAPNGTYYYIVTLKNSGLKPFTGPVYLGTK